MTEFHILKAGLERINDLEPLWNALRDHHVAVAPHLGTARSPEEAWSRRRAKYEVWLREPDAFVLIAEQAGRPVGYALVYMKEGDATWKTTDRIAELETLSVLPEAQRQGLGSALLGDVFGELAELGVRELSVGVIATNTGAIRFYEQRGMVPALLSLRGRVPEAR